MSQAGACSDNPPLRPAADESADAARHCVWPAPPRGNLPYDERVNGESQATACGKVYRSLLSGRVGFGDRRRVGSRVRGGPGEPKGAAGRLRGRNYPVDAVIGVSVEGPSQELDNSPEVP